MAAHDLDSRLGAPAVPLSLSDLADVALQQRGLVTRAQCRSAGMTTKSIEVRLRSERWRIAQRAVYQTSPGRDDWWTDALAALLSCGPDAAWSHGTAAAAWNLRRARVHEPVSIVLPHSRRITVPPGVVLHRLSDAARVDDLRWPWRTTVVDTVLDVGAGEDEDGQLAILARAVQSRQVSDAQVRVALGRRRAHRWRGLLLEVLSVVEAGAESPMEIRYHRDVEVPHRLPPSERQCSTSPGRRALHDVAYPSQRLLVELDGRLGHAGWAAQRRDGSRDRGSAAAGWLTTRAYWGDVTARRCELAGEVGAILRTRGWDGEPRPCRRVTCAIRACS